MSVTVESRLEALGLVIPPPQPPLGAYLPGKIEGSLLFLSGQTPQRDGLPTLIGRLGDGIGIDDAADAAALAALNALSLARGILGSLDKVAGVLRVTGYIASTPEFDQHPLVLNGASSVFVEAFGEAGRHARSAIGVVSLPQGVPVEIDVILQLVPDPADNPTQRSGA